MRNGDRQKVEKRCKLTENSLIAIDGAAEREGVAL
jgi:hypothetical protein